MEELLTRHQPRIHAVCRRIIGTEADAADATQEAMIAVVRGLARFDGRSAVGTWVYRIATNAALDELRRRNRRPHLTREHDLGDDHLGEVTGAHRLSDDGASGRVEQVADRMVLDAALQQLPEEFRVAVVLRDLADLDYAEIGAILGIPPGTVRSRISRGRSALAASLGNRSDLAGRPIPEHIPSPPPTGPPPT